MLSIVIPVHNSISIIEINLRNIVKRTSQSDEIILIDDKSDNQEQVQNLALRYNVKYLRIDPRTNYNRCLAINTGMKMAKNSWVVELDQDKTPVTNSFFNSLKQDINSNNNYKVVRFGHVKHHFPFAIKKKFIDKDNKAKFNAIVGGNVCYSKKFFSEIGGYDTSYDGNKGFQDFDLFYRMQINGGVLLYAKYMLADHIDSHVKTNSMYKTNMDRFFEKHGFYPEVD